MLLVSSSQWREQLVAAVGVTARRVRVRTCRICWEEGEVASGFFGGHNETSRAARNTTYLLRLSSGWLKKRPISRTGRVRFSTWVSLTLLRFSMMSVCARVCMYACISPRRRREEKVTVGRRAYGGSRAPVRLLQYACVANRAR